MTTERCHNQPFDPEEVFPNFIWHDDARPDELRLNQAGFFESEDGAWHLVRRAHTDLPVSEVQPHDLYSGRGVSYHNATQGAGLYFTNTVEAATTVTYAARQARQPRNLYIATIKPDEAQVLDATNALKDRKLREHAGVQTLRVMAVVPGMLWPTPKMYDFMYDTNTLVIAKPSAVQRYKPGMRAHINAETIRPRYAIVRDLGALTIIAHRPA
ncbi:MAG TPA: hypothetical protein VGE30_01420 [Candidatus Saccharimonadales bacterium]